MQFRRRADPIGSRRLSLVLDASTQSNLRCDIFVDSAYEKRLGAAALARAQFHTRLGYAKCVGNRANAGAICSAFHRALANAQNQGVVFVRKAWVLRPRLNGYPEDSDATRTRTYATIPMWIPIAIDMARSCSPGEAPAASRTA